MEGFHSPSYLLCAAGHERGIVVAASFTSLFVVCEFAKAVILNQFTLKLASLWTLVRKKSFSLLRQNIRRENQENQPGKPLKLRKAGGS